MFIISPLVPRTLALFLFVPIGESLPFLHLCFGALVILDSIFAPLLVKKFNSKFPTDVPPPSPKPPHFGTPQI
jgi:hypothetical protein